MSSPDASYTQIMELIAKQPEEADGVVGRLRRICGAATLTLSATVVAVSVLATGGARGVSAISGTGDRRLEELQFLLGEGPCVDALATRRPVLVPDLVDGAAARWPAYAPAAYECGARAVFAFPLQIGAARLGMLEFFREESGPLSTSEILHALTYAEIAVKALLDAQDKAVDGPGSNGLADGLADEVELSAELFQAQGMVMVQLGVGLAEAIARIRAYTFAENRRMHEVARDIVGRRIRFDRQQP
jgi:hypothetical protein